MENITENGHLNADCCHCTPEFDSAYGCADKKLVFTLREQAVLKRIREAAEEARAVKADLRMLNSTPVEDSPDKARALERLDRLRELRQELETERVAAAEERMRLLGHL